ncbi:unnamed protein product [Haemonchus placei]|uniref:Hepatocyte growth factor-regulated tyrosine kinase substrate n=1 Tax=Haemonchus placei TaxID=6290 RepID=A0A0N4WS24_HAEPC|nr:unnamed protein product [Haemonchus placei]
MWPSAGPMLQSPTFPPGPAPTALMQHMPGYGMQPSPYPMDPAGARPQYPPMQDQNAGGYDQNAMNYSQQQRMMMLHQQQQMQQVSYIPVC